MCCSQAAASPLHCRPLRPPPRHVGPVAPVRDSCGHPGGSGRTAGREHPGPLQGKTTQAGSLHIVRLALPCPPGPPASLESCSVSGAGTAESPRKLKRCLGGRTYIMCPALVPHWAPARVGTAEGLSTQQWPEARAAARGDRTGARAAGSASSSGPSRWRWNRGGRCPPGVCSRTGLWGGGGRGSHTQAFRLLPGDSCALDTALSMGKGTNKTDTTPVLRELTPQEDLRPTDQPCWAEGRAKTPSVAHEGTERDGHWPRRE